MHGSETRLLVQGGSVKAYPGSTELISRCDESHSRDFLVSSSRPRIITDDHRQGM